MHSSQKMFNRGARAVINEEDLFKKINNCLRISKNRHKYNCRKHKELSIISK
jgi:hypothetical protein